MKSDAIFHGSMHFPPPFLNRDGHKESGVPTGYTYILKSGKFLHNESEFLYDPYSQLYNHLPSATSYLFDANSSRFFLKVCKDTVSVNRDGFELMHPKQKKQSFEQGSRSLDQTESDRSVKIGIGDSTINSTANYSNEPILNKAQYMKNKMHRKKSNLASRRKPLKSDLICTLCMRKFKSIEKLHRHERASSLHRANLARLKDDSMRTVQLENVGARARQETLYSIRSEVSPVSAYDAGNMKLNSQRSIQGFAEEENDAIMKTHTNEWDPLSQGRDSNTVYQEEMKSNELQEIPEKSLRESRRTRNKMSSCVPMDILSNEFSAKPKRLKSKASSPSMKSSLVNSDITSYGPCMGESGLPSYAASLLQNFELFTASQDDLEKKWNTKIVIGQVGIRCIHCKSLPPLERNHNASTFPANVDFFQNILSFVVAHMKKCVALPEEVAACLNSYICASTVKSDGFNRMAEVLGLENAGTGVHFNGLVHGKTIIKPLISDSSVINPRGKQTVELLTTCNESVTRNAMTASTVSASCISIEKDDKLTFSPSLNDTDSSTVVSHKETSLNANDCYSLIRSACNGLCPVPPKDQLSSISWEHTVLSQMRVCFLATDDRTLARTHLPLSCPGFVCAYCGEGASGKKFFCTSKKVMRKQLIQMHNHLVSCMKCPVNVKTTLLKMIECGNEAKLAKEKLTSFLDDIWVNMGFDNIIDTQIPPGKTERQDFRKKHVAGTEDQICKEKKMKIPVKEKNVKKTSSGNDISKNKKISKGKGHVKEIKLWTKKDIAKAKKRSSNILKKTYSETDSILSPKDKAVTPSDFHYLVLMQLTKCAYSAADKATLIYNKPIGFPGLACKHCKSKKWFASSEVSLKNYTFPLMHDHILNCSECPKKIQDVVQYLHSLKVCQGKKRSSNKDFFQLLWKRLHPDANHHSLQKEVLGGDDNSRHADRNDSSGRLKGKEHHGQGCPISSGHKETTDDIDRKRDTAQILDKSVYDLSTDNDSDSSEGSVDANDDCSKVIHKDQKMQNHCYADANLKRRTTRSYRKKIDKGRRSQAENRINHGKKKEHKHTPPSSSIKESIELNTNPYTCGPNYMTPRSVDL